MRFTILDVVFISENIFLTKEAFGKVSSNISKKYYSGHMTIEELLTSGNTPTVLVVLLTPALMASDRFDMLTKYITSRMSSKDARYFRTYIIPHEMSFDEFMEQCDSGKNKALNEIGDVVHLDRFKDQDDILNEIVRFLENEGSTRRYYGYIQFKNILRVSVGLISSVIIWSCTIFSYLMFIVYFWLWKFFPELQKYIIDVFDTSVPTGNLSFWITMMLGISMVIPIANLLFLFRFGFSSFIKQLLISLRERKSVWYFFVTYFGFVTAINFMVTVVLPNMSILLLSLAIGFCLDCIRRTYYIGRKGFLIRKIDKNLCTPKGKSINNHILYSGEHNILHALHVPYSSPYRAKVFISYTHSCEWSQKMADELYEELSKNKIICFVDKYGIARGSSWRLALHEKLITDATHIICLVSEKTAIKEWPAAEIESALKIRSITGTPNIYVLLKEYMNEQEIMSPTVIYEEIFKREKEGDSFVSVIRNDKDILSKLVNTLSIPDFSSNILGVWNYILRIPLLIMEFITRSVKGILTVAGGIGFLIYMMFLIFQNYSVINSMDSMFDVCKLLALNVGNKMEKIVNSGFYLPVFLFACYLVSVELTHMVEKTFFVAYKSRIKSYFISQLIILSLSVIFIYMVFPYLSISNIIVGFIFFVTGFFLTSASNKIDVDIIGSCYYRNDSNKGEIVKLAVK